METAFKSVRDNGGLCVIAGNLSYNETISINPYDLIRGKRIVGTWGGETKPDNDIPMCVDLYLNKNFELDKLNTHEYSLNNINQAFDDLRQGKQGRMMINMDKI